MLTPGDSQVIELQFVRVRCLEHRDGISLARPRPQQRSGEKHVEKAEHHTLWSVGRIGQAISRADRMMEPRCRLEGRTDLDAPPNESRNVAARWKCVFCRATRANLRLRTNVRYGTEYRKRIGLRRHLDEQLHVPSETRRHPPDVVDRSELCLESIDHTVPAAHVELHRSGDIGLRIATG